MPTKRPKPVPPDSVLRLAPGTNPYRSPRGREPQDQPTRRTVEMFLRDLPRYWGGSDSDPTLKQLRREMEALEAAFRQTPRYKKLDKKIRKIESIRMAEWKKLDNEIAATRALYRTQGLTQKIIERLQTLADKVNAFRTAHEEYDCD